MKSPERWYRHVDDAAYACAKRIVDEKLKVTDEIAQDFIEEHHRINLRQFKKKVQNEIEAIAFINSQL